ncbi:MAG: sigma-70 family RNA polymerase sigma factor [Burkholderiaceae bacterium]|nr:sigma-70 family RNA polymerase sigma factor [Burkholderiaceae bacterium]
MSPAHEALIALIPRLRRYARLLCADAAAADDLVQDTLERACGRLSRWRSGSDLRAWTFTIMHNLFVSETRRPRYRLETPRDDAQPGQMGAEPSRDPAQAWDVALDLERALRALPQAQRQVLLLIAFEDMSYEQVAAIVGVPTGTVMSRLSRARSRLRELLDEDSARPAPPRLRLLK